LQENLRDENIMSCITHCIQNLANIRHLAKLGYVKPWHPVQLLHSGNQI
jgi:hypothetical protein